MTFADLVAGDVVFVDARSVVQAAPAVYSRGRPGLLWGATAMMLTIEAIYENGVLKPSKPLPLKEQETVRITIDVEGSWTERTAGLLKWTGDPEVLRMIAEDDEFSVLESKSP
jgi:predicted DNA-binding antitoxin AbrB/MazE fold protein